MIVTILLIAALICFLLAALEVSVPRVNLVALGLALITITLLIPLV